MEALHLLLVDDQQVVRDVIARELRLNNYRVQTAASGEEALRLVQSGQFDAIITDLDMPDIDGISVLRASKKAAPLTCVLILTGYGDMSSAIEALRLGADDYLLKPCDTDELMYRLNYCLEKKSLLDQLQQQNVLLEQEVEKKEQYEQRLKKSEQRFELALEASLGGIWDRDLVRDRVYFGKNWHKSLGYGDRENLNGPPTLWESLIHPDDRHRVITAREEHFSGKTARYDVEYRVKNKKGEWEWILSRGRVTESDAQGRPIRVMGTHTNISRIKAVETELQEARATLERRVKERTVELEETNIALNVLLAKRERDRQTLELQIVSNVAELIEPYIQKLSNSRLTGEQETYLSIISANISELTSSMAQDLAVKFSRLTPGEIQVANLVKIGKSTKEIAQILRLSPGTINIHRKNIRKKLGLTNQKANLQSVLSSYSQPV